MIKTSVIKGQEVKCLLLPKVQNLTKNAFSVAEALIALLIGSLILGASAPMISKQLKHNNMSDTQVQVLNRKIEELRTTQSSIPSGAVMYFDLGTCPEGWSALTSKYPSAANAFIRNQSGSGRTIGNWQQNAAPNIQGSFGPITTGLLSNVNPYSSGAVYLSSNSLTGGRGGNELRRISSMNFDASMSSNVYGRNSAAEVRPDNIALLACRRD